MVRSKYFRINANISTDMNDWLDAESERTGHSKTTLIVLALENYKQQKQVAGQVNELSALLEKMEQLSEKLE